MQTPARTPLGELALRPPPFRAGSAVDSPPSRQEHEDADAAPRLCLLPSFSNSSAPWTEDDVPLFPFFDDGEEEESLCPRSRLPQVSKLIRPQFSPATSFGTSGPDCATRNTCTTYRSGQQQLEHRHTGSGSFKGGFHDRSATEWISISSLDDIPLIPSNEIFKSKICCSSFPPSFQMRRSRSAPETMSHARLQRSNRRLPSTL